MQISDEMLGEMIYRALYQHQGGLWECVSPRHFWYDAASRLRAALSALSLPVQPVAWPGGFFKLGGDNRLRECASDGCHQHVSIRVERSGVGSDHCEPCARKIADLLTTPPVPPTKGPEDDLPEGWEGSADAMVWAKAYRYFVLKNNLTMSEAIDPGYMVGWFANYWAAITRDRLEPSAEDDLIAALEKRAKWHKCSCPEPCDDYGVFPGGCAGRYREDYLSLLALRSRPASALPVVGEAGKLAPGCCSAISPCSHQRQDPRSICDTCRSALIPSVQP